MRGLRCLAVLCVFGLMLVGSFAGGFGFGFVVLLFIWLFGWFGILSLSDACTGWALWLAFWRYVWVVANLYLA